MTYASDQKLSQHGLSSTSRRMLDLRDEVFEEWERRVRQLVKGAGAILQPILINTLPVFFDNIAEALTPDYPRERATSNTTIASAHGSERARMTSYGPEQVIHEYQIFRDALALVAERRQVPLAYADWQVIHGSIDAAVRESIREFTVMHDSFREKMAASLTHDLRTPLGTINAAANLVAMLTEVPKIADVAQKINQSCGRMDEMIRELLNILSSPRGHRLALDLSQFDIRALADEVAAQVNMEDPGRCVVSGQAVDGYWCRNSVRRALENLTSNAVKYGDGATIYVHVAATHGRMMLSVRNTGQAIDRQHRATIFEYLRREDASGQIGWGIGLPFVQSVAESHGGSVAVDSAAQTGTTFTIDMPVDARPFAADAVSSGAAPARPG